MKFIIGKKMSMTQVWSQDKVLAVTPVQAGPCVITQVRTTAKDGYNALQLAFGDRKEKNIKKPQLGHVKKLGIKPAHFKEFRTEEATNFQVGDVISAETFAAGDTINATGTSKGKGFQGVVKRHHFHGFRKTHGNKDQERMPGSIGPKGPARVFKGTRMGGRMGGERVTITNLEVISIDAEKGIIYVKGAVPGAINSLVMLSGAGDLMVNTKKAPEIIEEKVVEPVEAVATETEEAVPAIEEKVEETKAEEDKTPVKEEAVAASEPAA